MRHCKPCKGRECKGQEYAPKTRYFCFCLRLVGCYDIDIYQSRNWSKPSAIFKFPVDMSFFLDIYYFSRQNKREHKREQKRNLLSHEILRTSYLFHWQFDYAVRFSSNIIRLLSYNKTGCCHFGIMWLKIMKLEKKWFNIDSIIHVSTEPSRYSIFQITC